MPSSTAATTLLLELLLIQGYGQSPLLSEAAATGCGYDGQATCLGQGGPPLALTLSPVNRVQ